MTRHRPWLVPLIFAITVTALLFVLHTTPVGEQLSDWRALASLLDDDSPRAQMLFVAISSLLIMIGIPRLVFFTLGGFTFGFWAGLGWSVCAILIGSWLAFRIARACGREWLSARFGSHRHFGRIIGAAPSIATIAVLRLLPISNAVVNAGLAIGRVDSPTFLAGSLLGFLPHGVLAVMVGTGLAAESVWENAIHIGGAAVLLSAIAWTAGQRLRRN